MKRTFLILTVMICSCAFAFAGHGNFDSMKPSWRDPAPAPAPVAERLGKEYQEISVAVAPLVIQINSAVNDGGIARQGFGIKAYYGRTYSNSFTMGTELLARTANFTEDEYKDLSAGIMANCGITFGDVLNLTVRAGAGLLCSDINDEVSFGFAVSGEAIGSIYVAEHVLINVGAQFIETDIFSESAAKQMNISAWCGASYVF